MIRGERCIFQHLDFALNPGELLLLQGRNGSGKTSLLRAIAGLLALEHGDIRWNEVPISMQRQAFHAELVWLTHRSGLKLDLTPAENLRFEASLRPRSRLDLATIYERLGLSRLKNLPTRSLSAGQQRRVALARMLMADVPLWLMDEPFTNLDSDGRQLVIDLTEEHLAGGGLCVMAAHQDVQVAATTRNVNL
tara:strand:- start:8251 stop:8829 length:579 start_codon:yes stop_codon:yes gene_type:complete